MINVGLIGLGMMGRTHLDVYTQRKDVRVIAISDILPDRLSGKEKSRGNIPGQAQSSFDPASVRRYPLGMELIQDPDVELVDICLPTPLHLEHALAALELNKHVLVEKPVCRTSAQANKLVAAAKKSKGRIMAAMCIRFWPEWSWLREAIRKKTYGKVLSAQFRRVASHPGGFYTDGRASGGAILDLHIHDTDFVQFCFGLPSAVSTRGYSTVTGEPDHVVTHYLYEKPGAPQLVVAEGGWVMAPGFGFQMQYTINFARATAVYDLSAPQPLRLYQNGKSEPVKVPAGMGYEHEIAYFLDCIRRRQTPKVVTLEDAARSVAIVEAEAKSLRTGKPVALHGLK